MAKSKSASPRIIINVTPEQYESAKRSHSGACLIADAIKRDYPAYANVKVDMATIAFSDRAAGKRYTYITPERAQLALLYFDQGWQKPTAVDDPIQLQRAARIDPIRTSTQHKQTGDERLADLEAKEAAGETLTRIEQQSLTKLRNRAERPTSPPPAEVDKNGTVHGGRPPVRGTGHPNLLRSRRRHFGAKLSDPGVVFREAVEEAVNLELANRAAGGPLEE